jgi:hypothetical protein
MATHLSAVTAHTFSSPSNLPSRAGDAYSSVRFRVAAMSDIQKCSVTQSEADVLRFYVRDLKFSLR